MTRLAIALFFTIIQLHAQGRPLDLLLPETTHVVGMAVDQDGNPVLRASIDYTYGGHWGTGLTGRIELDTRAPAVVIRKEGYRSAFMRTQQAGEVHVTMEKLTETPPIPSCSGAADVEGIDGWAALFQFPRIPGVIASPQGADADYGARSYYIETKEGRRGIRHGSGVLWGSGMPMDQVVWQFVKYEEALYLVGGQTFMAARGEFRDGKQWRTLGRAGESASYSGVDEPTAKILDRVLDGVCLKSASPQ
jgi:hypothetical protein